MSKPNFGNFEFDAPQWVDLLKEHNSYRDVYDKWFRVHHPSHEIVRRESETFVKDRSDSGKRLRSANMRRSLVTPSQTELTLSESAKRGHNHQDVSIANKQVPKDHTCQKEPSIIHDRAVLSKKAKSFRESIGEVKSPLLHQNHIMSSSPHRLLTRSKILPQDSKYIGNERSKRIQLSDSSQARKIYPAIGTGHDENVPPNQSHLQRRSLRRSLILTKAGSSASELFPKRQQPIDYSKCVKSSQENSVRNGCLGDDTTHNNVHNMSKQSPYINQENDQCSGIASLYSNTPAPNKTCGSSVFKSLRTQKTSTLRTIKVTGNYKFVEKSGQGNMHLRSGVTKRQRSTRRSLLASSGAGVDLR